MSQFKFTSSDFVTVGKWLVVLCAAVSLSNTAFAQAATGVLGGLTKAQTILTDVKTGIYSIVSVFALVYLLYVGVMAFAERKSWADFGWAIIYISLVGASLVLADWAWKLFTS